MSKITDMLFGTHSQRELRRIDPIVKQIESLRPQMIALSDDELRAKTDEFKKRLNEGETLDDILPEAYAAVREGARRSLGMEPFRVQLIGAIILHQGRIAEMRTGEGKTLGRGVDGTGLHIYGADCRCSPQQHEQRGETGTIRL